MFIKIYRDSITNKEKVVVRTPVKNTRLTKKQFIDKVTPILEAFNYEVTYKGER